MHSTNRSAQLSTRKCVASGLGLPFCIFSSVIKQQKAVVQVFLTELGNEELVKAQSPLIGWGFVGEKAAVSTETYL